MFLSAITLKDAVQVKFQQLVSIIHRLLEVGNKNEEPPTAVWRSTRSRFLCK
jgi:hypothetical protein